MTSVSKVFCPRCGTPLPSTQAPQVGQKVQCPQCATSFLVPGEAAPTAPRPSSRASGS